MTTKKTEKALVQMKLNPCTMEKINELKELIGEDNRTTLTANAIAIYHELAKSVRSGGKVYIKNPDGSRDRLILVGC